MVHLTTPQKKKLFVSAYNKAKATGKTGEEFLDEVFANVEDTYDKLDPEYGLTMNEQWEFDKHWTRWMREMNM